MRLKLKKIERDQYLFGVHYHAFFVKSLLPADKFVFFWALIEYIRSLCHYQLPALLHTWNTFGNVYELRRGIDLTMTCFTFGLQSTSGLISTVSGMSGASLGYMPTHEQVLALMEIMYHE